MKKLSRLLLVLGLMLCISLTAYAEDAPAAQPTAKEPRTLTARTGTETSLWNAYAFLAQHGTAYRFAPCAVQTPALRLPRQALPPVCAAAPASGMLTRQCPLTTLFTTATLPCPAKNLPEQENYCIQHLHFDRFRCMIGAFELFVIYNGGQHEIVQIHIHSPVSTAGAGGAAAAADCGAGAQRDHWSG